MHENIITVTRPMRPCHAGREAKGYAMKKWKALLAGAFAGALIASFALVGCSSSNDGDQMSSSDEGSTADMAAKADPVELHVFAANSLQKALPEVQELYTKAHPEVSFADTQFEASGTLVSKLAGTDGQTQAHADIFIAASTSSMDKADKNGSIDASTRLNMFNNDLVLAAATNSDLKVSDLADLGTDAVDSFAIGEPNAVPAGKYALQSLVSASLATSSQADDGTVSYEWDASVADKVNAGAQKVGDVAEYVSSGNVQLGFVYSSDIYRYDGIKAIYTVPADMHKAIVYPGAVTSDSANAQVAQDFLNFCMTDPDAQAVFQKYGFELAAA